MPYTEDDLRGALAGLAPPAALFVQIAEPDEAMAVALTIDGKPVPLRKAYNSIYGSAPKRTFLGFYADVSSLSAGAEHPFALTLPPLKSGQFQGLFFETSSPISHRNCYPSQNPANVSLERFSDFGPDTNDPDERSAEEQR